MNNDFISIGECAKLLNIDRSHLLKYIKAGKFGPIQLEFRRDKDKQNQKVATISKKDFKLIKKIREQEGFGNSKIVKSTKGHFYVVQTNPDSIPSRYKFGFTNDLDNRIRSYKSVCPNLKIVATFPCDSIHELPLIKMVSKYGKRAGQELFEIKDINTVIKDIKEVLSKLIP
ncbi:MAG: GIY-YIG nuclease family protein [Candidatus Altiarchaeota archaeon]|nr:GIY-YIG nuclease family protein [Candidatus Altiarchaeota archaeon]